jgi:hypothetical protein
LGVYAFESSYILSPSLPVSEPKIVAHGPLPLWGSCPQPLGLILVSVVWRPPLPKNGQNKKIFQKISLFFNYWNLQGFFLKKSIAIEIQF